VTGQPVIVVDDGPMLRATVPLPGCSPERALAAFTDPAMLARWWGGELSTDLTPGSAYTVRFPKIGRTLTGEVLGYEPVSRLEFTWNWDRDTGSGMSRTVVVSVSAASGAGGTRLTVTHGPHADSEAEQAARAEHCEGWEFFLPRLVALISE
jgi:uncharacterized protein YndB with AHSA1/START domain